MSQANGKSWEKDHKNKAGIESMGGPLSPLNINLVCTQTRRPFRLFSLSTDSQLPVFISSSFVPLTHLAALHRVLHKRRTRYELNAYQNGTFWHFRTTSSARGVSKRHAANVAKVVIRDSTAFTLTSINKIKCLLISWLPRPNANSLVFFLFTSVTLAVCMLRLLALGDRCLGGGWGCSFPKWSKSCSRRTRSHPRPIPAI